MLCIHSNGLIFSLSSFQVLLATSLTLLRHSLPTSDPNPPPFPDLDPEALLGVNEAVKRRLADPATGTRIRELLGRLGLAEKPRPVAR